MKASVSSKTAVTPRLSPVTEHVIRILRERITRGLYQEGNWLPSERELAQDFQVSRVIIRTALGALAQEGLIDRSARCRTVVRSVEVAVPPTRYFEREERSYRRTISLWIWPGVEHPASSALVQGIRRALDADKYRLLLESPSLGSWDDAATDEAAFLERVAREEDCEAVLVWCVGGEASLPALRSIQAAGKVILFLDRLPPMGFIADHVGIDNLYSAREAVRHLIGLGHRRIVHITNYDKASTVYEREQGYRRAMAEAGLIVRPEWIVRDMGDEAGSARMVAADAVLALLQAKEPPTAAFTVNDGEAFLLLDALRRNGVRVPEEFSVVGFDGVERWRPGTPYLTSMYQPFGRMGERAVELLRERLDGEAENAARHLILSAQLIIGETTGPPPV